MPRSAIEFGYLEIRDMLKATTCAFSLFVLAVAGVKPASAITINFDDQGLSGPSFFATAGPAQSLNIDTSFGNVLFEGGVILEQTSNLPANQTAIYGTASFADSSLVNPLKITFESPVQNFFLDVYNGNIEPIIYTVADNAGNSSSFSLDPNLQGGQSKIGFEATGTEITIASSIGSSIDFDFFIDNITFNEDLPDDLPDPVSESSTVLGSALLLAMGVALRRSRLRQRAS